MNRKSLDLITGENGENSVCPILEEYFNVKLFKTATNAIFDFYTTDGVYFEVKTRNNEYNKYPSTMVGYNKIEFANKLDKSVYFVFNFTDGVYYYKYDITKLKELEIKQGGRRDRGRYEYKAYCYIKIELLTKIGESKAPPVSPLLKKRKVESENERELVVPF
jgi:hypothetical protein